MALHYKVIDTKQELLEHKERILGLFQRCFDKSLDEKIWQWAYLGNTIGDAVISLCFDDSKLVAHYGAVPICLRKGYKQIKTCLSMNVMVDVHYRKYGIFIEIARQVYDRAKALGFQLTIGFPNKSSLPGFKKRLGWEIGPADYIALLTKNQLLSVKRFTDYLQNKELAILDVDNKKFLEWRLSKPLQTYYNTKGIIIKEFKNHPDIVFINEDFYKVMEAGKRYHILIDASINDFIDSKVFDYQFGYKLFDESLNGIRFKKDLLMSDIF